MKEEERYDLIEDDLAYAIVDKETHKTFENDSIDFCNICDVLNQQDRQIKELSQENQQLKQQLQRLIKDLKILSDRAFIDVKGYKILWLNPNFMKKNIDSLIKKYEVEK